MCILAGRVSTPCGRWGASEQHMGQCRPPPSPQGSVPAQDLGVRSGAPFPHLMPPNTPPCLASQLHPNCRPFPEAAPALCRHRRPERLLLSGPLCCTPRAGRGPCWRDRPTEPPPVCALSLDGLGATCQQIPASYETAPAADFPGWGSRAGSAEAEVCWTTAVQGGPRSGGQGPLASPQPCPAPAAPEASPSPSPLLQGTWWCQRAAAAPSWVASS